jgi:putative transposase
MGRPLRIVISGMAYHVMARGNERKNIFRQDGDYKKFLSIINDAADKYSFKLYAYTLMSNHYHILIKIEQPNLSAAMQYINTRYGIFFNWKHKRIGHLFQSRFNCVIVEHGPDLLEVMRYIHLNPLRAGMVEKLDEYTWTSHNQYRGTDEKGPAEPWHLLKKLSTERREAIKKYEAFMSEGEIKDKDGDVMAYFGKQAIGSDDFVRDIKLMFKEKDLSKEINNRVQLKKIYPAERVIAVVCKYYKISKEEMLKKGRWNNRKPVVAYLLSQYSGLKNTEIAELMGGLHPSGIGKMTDGAVLLMKKGRPEAKDILQIEKELKSGSAK